MMIIKREKEIGKKEKGYIPDWINIGTQLSICKKREAEEKGNHNNNNPRIDRPGRPILYSAISTLDTNSNLGRLDEIYI